MPVPQLLLYAGLLFFVTAVTLRTLHYRRQPRHLRWELYPVAHERGRAGYGGSHFEVPDHWSHERRPDHAAEARAMASEILLLEGVRRHNPSLWRFSLPFHAGCYLLVVWLVGMLTLGVIGEVPVGVLAVVDFVGLLAVALGLIGALGLLAKRLGDPALRAYNAPADFVNLGVWLAYFAWILITRATSAVASDDLLAVSAAVVRLQPAPLGTQLAVELVLGTVLLAYLPLSRMFHFVAKYFLYHDVRWEDAPNPRGGPLERRLQQAMAFGVAWDAPHLRDAATWGQAARPNGQEDVS